MITVAAAPTRQAQAARFEVGATGIGHFGAWRGRSGRRYVVSIYPIGACPDYEHAVALAVRRDGNVRRVLAALDLGALPLAALSGTAFAAARQAGADEIHLHLLAGGRAERRRMIDDLAAEATALAAPVAAPARPGPDR